jgi:transcriptional regulator GlxA family with amidase domain
VTTDSGIGLVATSGFADIAEADILLIPGAAGAMSMRDESETLDWIRMMHARSQWTASVCTGSLILGAAGLLRGLRATTHWAVHERLAAFGALPIDARVVEDGKVITGAGVSAGIDLPNAGGARQR